MTSSFEEAKRLLKIQSVVQRHSLAFIGDEIDTASIDNIPSETQAYRGVYKVKEVEVSDEKSKWWEYLFFYSAGIRKIRTDVEESESREDDDERNDILLEVTSTYCANYKSNEKLSKECINAFSEENVGYHVWPYWREFVQSSCCRLNVTLLQVPLYFCSSTQDSNEET